MEQEQRRLCISSAVLMRSQHHLFVAQVPISSISYFEGRLHLCNLACQDDEQQFAVMHGTDRCALQKAQRDYGWGKHFDQNLTEGEIQSFAVSAC
jgi:hypothetical protein